MKNILIIVGLILVVAAGAVWFMGGQQLNQRYPAGWEWQINSLGRTSYADETTGDFPEGTTLADDPVNITIRTVNATAAEEAGQVVIADNYQQRNATTDEVEWEYTIESVVDASTGKHVAGDNTGDYYLMPRNVEQTTYTLSNSTYQDLQMSFVREEEIVGINTYLYQYTGDLPNKAAYEGFVEFEDNQDVLCFDYTVQYWVEPITGEIIQFSEVCEGDWVVDTETGDRLYALSRWGAETTGDDLIRQANLVKSQLNTYRWMSLYIPAILGLAGIALLAYAFVSKNEGNPTA